MDFESLDSDSSTDIGPTRKRVRRISSSDDSSSDEVEQCGNFTNEGFVWKAENHTPTIHGFSSVVGATVDTQNRSRREIFELFFNQELVTKVITETNKYGATDENFIPLADDELKIFIAVNILMSLVCKPTIQSYWSTDKSLETPYFKNIMTHNWYSSPILYRELYSMKTNVCGTARINRKEMPQEFKSQQLQRGEAIVFSTREMAAIKWKDKKDVVLLTTMHGLEFAETGKINRYTGQKCLKPTAVQDYNQYMSGVDVGDQMLIE
ncbi:piggyBac transposable element-derived protein 4-like [Polyergus mexicanus]|uniref:piggyBac transposable element-derived protein 4-like n=1 Tax=Polyergus mexicanus TaxID=615972 RepID=UPI0038B4460C